MKKTILLYIFVITISYSFAQTNVYHPFPDSNAIWIGKELTSDGMGCKIYDVYNLYISGDTTIGAISYHKLYKDGYRFSPNCPPGGDFYYYNQLWGFFRQDTINKKIYLNYGGNDTLAYDFNLNVGDTLSPTFLTAGYPDFIVESIDSVLVGNEYRRKYWIISEYFQNYMYIIEGIGTNYGAFELYEPNWGEYAHDLWCIYQDNELVWTRDPSGSGCELILSNYEYVSENQISISPNPFKLYAELRIPENYTDLTLTIYNSFGQKIREIKNSNETIIKIERDNLESGLYFIQIAQDNNHILTKKIMIQD